MLAEKRLVLLPLRVLLGFLVFSELLLIIGPYSYDITNYPQLFFYLFVVNVAFYWGYKKGVKNTWQSSISMGQALLAFLIIAGFLLTIRRMTRLWAGRGLSLALSSIVYALANSGDVYHNAVEISQVSQLSLFWVLMEPIRWAAIPLGVANWRKISKMLRMVVVLTIIVEIVAWLGIGTRKGLFDVIVMIFFFSIANSPQWIIDKAKRKKLVVIGAVALFAFLFYFVMSGASRKGYGLTEFDANMVSQDIKPFYEKAPDWLLYSLCSIESYLCQGYYALSKGLEMGIRPITFGGSGWFTIMLMRKVGYDPEPGIYMVELEKFGIDRHINWHTIYLWLANDLTFIGVPIFIFIVGYLFAVSWRDVLYGKNQTAIPFFALMLIMVFYFYANNQVMSFSFIPLVFWTIIYFVTRNNHKVSL